MPKTNTVSAFKCRGTWRSLWFSLNYCQGFISIKLFSSPINFCPSFLLSFHLFLAFMFKCHIIHLNQFWYSLSTVLLCWLSDLLLPVFEPLKCASPLLEVQSGRDTTEVLIRLNAQRMCAFFLFLPPSLFPQAFWLNYHPRAFSWTGFILVLRLCKVGDLRDEKVDTIIFGSSHSYCSFYRVLLGS